MGRDTEAALPNEVVGDAYTHSSAWDVVVGLADGPARLAGTDGEARAAEFVAGAFRERGLEEVTVDEFPIPGWVRGSSSLEAAGSAFDSEHEVIALPGSPPGTTTGRLVDLGHGLQDDAAAADLEGAVALAGDTTPPEHGRHVHRLEKYGWAAAAGADAFVYRTDRPGCLPPTGDVGVDDGPGPIPAVGVSREVGAWLRRRCRDESPEATVSVDCEVGRRQSRNVSGALGPETDSEVLVTAHLDAHDVGSGANDNGAGCALVAETARLLSLVEDRLETRVRFVTFGAEEVGFHGSEQWVQRHDTDSVRAVVNADGIGYSRTLDLYTHGFDGIAAAFEAATDALDVPSSIQASLRPHSDHWPFVRRGVPGAQARSATDAERGWTHTHADTVDKLDPRDLRDLSVVLAEGVLRLARADHAVEHVQPSAIRDAAREAGLEAGLRATGDWPWD